MTTTFWAGASGCSWEVMGTTALFDVRKYGAGCGNGVHVLWLARSRAVPGVSEEDPNYTERRATRAAPLVVNGELMRVALGSIIVLMLASACGASAPVPEAQRTETLAAVRAAEEVGAPNVPNAALHLKMSRDQIATAEALIRDEENEQATLVLLRAQADAELALELAREQQMRDEAAEARDRVEKLKKEALGE